MSKTPFPSTHPHARVIVRDHGQRRPPAKQPSFLFGRDIRIDPGVLSDYCFQPLGSRVDDLLHVAAAVGFADRLVRRATTRGWRRELTLSIAVHEADFWQQPVITTALVECLDFGTGDVWNLEFTGGRTPLAVNPQAPLDLRVGPSAVLPFSDGLDSLAAARLATLGEHSGALILVTTGGKHDIDRALRRRQLNARRHRVSFPFAFTPVAARLSEPSYRSRGFVFGVVAGVAAHLLEANQVILGESGQGSLGPWLTPVGNEAPDTRMHPAFTARLGKLFGLVLGKPVRFEHPHLWNTKGDTLDQLRRAGYADDWWETRSCGRDSRHMNLNGRRVQCGACAACLLRRQSLHAANLFDERDTYMWQRLFAPTFAAAAADGARPARLNDERQAMCGVLAAEDLARFADGPLGNDRVVRAADELAPVVGLSPNETAGRLRRLLDRHRDEWDAFVAALGTDSFIARWAEVARC